MSTFNINAQNLGPPCFVFSDTRDKDKGPVELLRITSDGRIIINEAVAWDEAAQRFWAIVAEAQKPKLIARLAEAKELLRYFAPAPGHSLSPDSTPARIEKFLAGG